MNYVDRTLVQMASPLTRGGLFDTPGLEQIVRAAYDAEAMNVEGPYQAVFDELQLGYAVLQLGTMEGFWSPAGGMERVEARFQISGMGNGSAIRVDALWRGSIVARVAPPSGKVIHVEATWPQPGLIDAEIVTALGALPTDPVVLEQERRTRFLARIRISLRQPALFTDAQFDNWLRSMGVASVSDVLAQAPGLIQPGALQIRFSAPSAGPTSPKALPVAAALLIRDQGFSVSQLLLESKAVREQLEVLGVVWPVEPTLRARQRVLVIWMVPEGVFDDSDWPGATGGMTPSEARAARRAAAGIWLAREGIGLAVTP